MTRPEKIVFIGGTGRSGSTLLDLLLGNHPRIESVGEVHRLNWYARDNPEPCTCGRPVADCPYWARIEDTLRQTLGWTRERRPLTETEMMIRPESLKGYQSLIQKAALVCTPPPLARRINRVVARPHEKAMEHSLHWYAAISAAMNADIIVDSTKDARRLKLLFLTAPEQFRLIYLVRDGRAVTASTIRRTGVSMEEAARMWVRSHRKNLLVRRWIPKSRTWQVRYEELCRKPDEVARELCRFLGVHFDEAMLKLEKTDAHNIGGNPMRFRKGETTVRLDDQWRRQLSSEELSIFQRTAGLINDRLGYGGSS